MLFKNLVSVGPRQSIKNPGACYEKLLLTLRFTAVITYPVAAFRHSLNLNSAYANT